MIGPIPIDNINIDNISNNDDNDDGGMNNANNISNGTTNEARRRHRELWIEHERRQRTIRFLMMLLMMLILMDGEQQSANEELNKKKALRARNHNSSSNKHNSDFGDNSGKISGDDNNSSALKIPKKLFRTREELDRKIQISFNVNNNHRLKYLFDLNNGTDEEKKIWDWVQEDFELTMKHQTGGAKNGDDNDDDEQNGKGGEEIESLVEGTEAILEEAKRKVHHYPRNATGHFRGYWTRIVQKPNSRDNLPFSSTEGSPAEANEESRKESTQVKEGSDHDEDEDNLTDKILVSHEEVKKVIQDTARHFSLKDTTGVYILPKGTKMDGSIEEQMELLSMSFDNISTKAGRKMTTILNKNNTAKGENELHEFHSIKPPQPEPEPLYITEMEGRLHFHFFSRSIRGMKEISLIDGYVKIRDINDYGFTDPRKHLFLRLHGVIIHSIGRISLVANDGPLRSAFVIFNSDENRADGDDGKEKNDFGGQVGGKAEKEMERRKLQESITELKTGGVDNGAINSNHAHEKGLETLKDKIDNIRTRALWIYSDLFDPGDIGGSDWKLFSSNIDPKKTQNWYHFIKSTTERRERDPTDIHDTQTLMQRRRLLKEEDIDSGTEKKSFENTDTVKQDNVPPEGELWTSSFVQAYPYVPYEKNVTVQSNIALLKKTHQSIPEMFFNNYCEFEINLDVNETQWTVSEWREMGKRIIRDVYLVNPFVSENISNNENDELPYESFGDSLLQYSQERDEALVMNLFGTMESSNCDFTLSLNATAFRTDWEQTKYKATIYSVYMMLASLAQIVVLLRQLIHAQSQLATRVSLLCIGWHTVIDAILCIEHIMLCLMVPPISTAFFMVALFKFLLFYVIEMKYMAMIMEARSSAAGLPNSASDTRRRLAALQFRFFSALFLAIVAIWYLILGHYRRKLVFMAMYSFWVPQIVYNIFTEAKKPLHKHFIYGNSITRLNLPLILFGIPKNFMQEIEPEFPLDHKLCLMLVVWVAIQTALLVGQMKYGARFMIPKRFLPPKYNYARPIPASLLPPQLSSSSSKLHSSSDESEGRNTLLENDVLNETGPRNRKEKRSRCSENNGITTVHEEENDRPSIDCVICYNPIDVLDRRAYMLAPCDHIFHRNCLEQWMDVKMECPICRTDLPAT